MADVHHAVYCIAGGARQAVRLMSVGGGGKSPFSLMDFNSRRSPVLGTRGMVGSSQPLASEVCLQ